MYQTLNGQNGQVPTQNGQVPPQLTEAQPHHQDLSTGLDSPNSNHEQLSKGDDWSEATKELLDILPQVWTRGLLYFLAVFVAITLPWAMFSQVDETGKARGRLEPQGKTVKLDAPVAGTVAAIQVKEGEAVKAGQRILALESELVSAELQQQQRKLEGEQNRLIQLEFLRNQLSLILRTQQQQNQAQQIEKQAQLEQARQELDALRAADSLEREEKAAQVEQARQAIQSSQAVYELEKIRLEAALEKIPRYQQAYEEGALSQERLLEVQQEAKEAQQNISKAESDIRQAQSHLREQQGSYEKITHQASSEIEQAQLRWQEQEGSYKSLVHSGQLAVLKCEEQLKNLETDITTLKADIAQSKTQIEALKFELNQRVLAAPLEGTVFQLPIQGKGEVVQPGDMLAEIAPKGTSLSLQAEMATTDSGSLAKGMPVKLKFDAYPFQDYGVVEGELVEISPTTEEIETPEGKVAAYNLEIQLHQTCIPTATECIALRPGDTATAEVVVRQRRVMDFILDPFKKLQKGGLEL